ncbi:MAG: signal peptide prediction [Burkholderiales bacterium]
MIRALRYAWAAPATLVGLASAAVAMGAGAHARRVDGVLEIGGGRVGRWMRPHAGVLRFSAITFGHVVLGRDDATLARLRAHEHVHVRQYERWGVLFFPLYLASSAWQWARGRDAYRDNRFEKEAFAEAARAEVRSRRTCDTTP